MEKKKNNKKKVLLIILLLIVIFGSIGYGVYSYYYTQGTVHTDEETIEIKSFNPVLYYSSGYEFLHGTHTESSVSCSYESYNSTRHEAVYNCSSHDTVVNQGSTAIKLEISNIQFNYTPSDASNISISNQKVEYNENDNPLQVDAGTDIDFTVSCTLTIGNISSDPSQISDDAQYASTPVTGAEVTVDLEYNISATELH